MNFDPYAIVDQGGTPGGAADELADRLDGVMDGRISNVPFPWRMLTNLTQALLPGSICVVCGDPGVGKTFWVLQCLQDWHANGFSAAVFFIEKDRKFHTHRLLAQLENNGSIIEFEWVKANPKPVIEALGRHRDYIDELGECIHSAPATTIRLPNVLDWIRKQCDAGVRVLVVDPITAISTGQSRWEEDQQFMHESQKVLNAAGASLVLVTHPKKGWKGASGGHEQAGGAAYHRFSDTNIWLSRKPAPVSVRVQTRMGETQMELRHFTQLHKTRDAKGAGLEIGFEFGQQLMFAEQGVIVEEA